MAIRRKASFSLVKLRDEERYRLPVALQREKPKIRLRSRMERCIQQETSVSRPTRGLLVLAGLEQNLLIFRAVRQLLIQVVRAVSVGGKNNAPPIRRPHWIIIYRRAKGDPSAGPASSEIQQPDVCTRVAGLAYGQPRPIRRERQRVLQPLIVARFPNRSQDLALPAVPGELHCPGLLKHQDLIVRSGKGSVPAAAAAVITNLLRDGHGLPFQLQPSVIERLGHQRTFADKEQIAGTRVRRRRIAWLPVASHQWLGTLLFRLRVHRAEINAALRFANRGAIVDEMPPVR